MMTSPFETIKLSDPFNKFEWNFVDIHGHPISDISLQTTRPDSTISTFGTTTTSSAPPLRENYIRRINPDEGQS